MTTEQKFIKELQTKDTKQGAFSLLVTQYKEPLYWQIRHIVKSHDDTDDVLQNTFIKIYQNIDKFKGESKLFSWLYRIATNEALTHLKKEAKHNKLSSSEAQENALEKLESDVYFEGNDIQYKLQKAIATLPEKQQLVFNMKYFQELKFREIAEILETSEGALKASYHIANKKIKDFLKTN